MSITPGTSDIQAALRSFMLSVLPPQVDVVAAVDNQVPEPVFPDFVVMTALRFERLETNIDGSADVRFTGSVAPETATFTGSIVPAPTSPGVMPSGVLTVSQASGFVAVGSVLTGASAAPGTRITAQLTGFAGGAGTYAVTPAQTVAGPMTATYGLLSVSAVSFGTILVGAPLFGVGVPVGTTIAAFGPSPGGGSGGVGTYLVSQSFSVPPETLSSGATTIQMNSQVTMQLDFHAVDPTSSDMANTVAAAFRDDYGVTFFNNLPAPQNQVAPLFADDPRYMPFINEQQQYEWRWVLEAKLQANQVITVPQQYSDSLTVVPNSVVASFG